MKYLLEYVISVLGSMTGIVLWFHFDLDARYAVYKIERGRKREDREIEKRASARKAHEELLREEKIKRVAAEKARLKGA